MDSKVIKMGSYVMIKGLKQNSEFNGLHGKIVGYHEKEKRWNVELSKPVQSQIHISVKTANLQCVLKGMFFFIAFFYRFKFILICKS